MHDSGELQHNAVCPCSNMLQSQSTPNYYACCMKNMQHTYIECLLWANKATSEDHLFGFASTNQAGQALCPPCPEHTQESVHD